MKALIFAAGFGERMRPLTERTPKPLLSVGGTPLIVWHLRKLAALGVDEVVINTSWLADQFPQVLGDGSAFGLRLTYSFEAPPAGNRRRHAACIAVAGRCAVPAGQRRHLDRFRFRAAVGRAGNLAQLVLVDRPAYAARADFALDADGKVREDLPATLTYSGIGMYRPALLRDWPSVIGQLPEPSGAAPRFALAPILRAQMAAGLIDGIHHAGRWTDVGTPQRLAELDAQLLRDGG